MAKNRKPRRKPSKARKIWGRIGAGMLILFLLLGFGGLGTFFVLYSTTDLPDPNKDFTTNTTFLYYADGTTKLGSLAVQNREMLDYKDIPQVVKDAVVAAENRSFWEDPGISVSGILRSVVSIARGSGLQGGSTITQQYIKILYLTSDQNMTRKIREAILAIKMGSELPKEEILEGYLNTIYFGRGAYGIQAAAKSYFLKPAKDLSVDQVAALAAILNNPAGFNPSGGEKNLKRLLERYQYVLSGMLEMGKISKADYDAAYPALPEFPEVPDTDRYGGPKGFLVSQVESELADLGFDQAEIQGSGLQVVTTIDKKMQDAANAAATKYTKMSAEKATPAQDPENLHPAIASVDTATGGILALYGGPDFTKNSRNWATTPRPSASTFKAFVTVAGLRNGYSLKSVLKGNTFLPRGDSVNVRNEQSHQYGPVTLRTAIAKSVNTAFVDMTVEMEDGPKQVVKAANDAGAPTGPGWTLNNRIGLGTAEVSPLDLANSYATFADSGKYKKTHIVTKVSDRQGRVLYEAKVKPEQRIDSNIAANLTDGLTSVVTEGTGVKAKVLNRPVAGKTGTNGVEDAITAAWFVGYTRQISTAVMYVAGEGGNEDLQPFKQPQDSDFFGSGYPLMTWIDYMQVASEGMPVVEFDKPEPIKATTGETETTPPATKTSEPTASATPTLTQEPELEETQEPDPVETEEPEPTPTQEPDPVETEEPEPTPDPTEGSPSSDPTGGQGTQPTPSSGPSGQTQPLLPEDG